jgi:hypothetical protein
MVGVLNPIWGVRFPECVQTNSEVRPASSAVDTGSPIRNKTVGFWRSINCTDKLLPPSRYVILPHNFGALALYWVSTAYRPRVTLGDFAAVRGDGRLQKEMLEAVLPVVSTA